MELAIKEQKNLPLSGSNSFSPFSPLPKVPSIETLLDAIGSDSVVSPAVCSGPSGHFVSVETDDSKNTQRYSVESVCLPEVGVYSQPVDALQTDNGRQKTYADPVYSVPVDIIRPTSNPQTSTNRAEESSGCASPVEPVYAEVMYVVPQSGTKTHSLLQNKEENIYSLADVGNICKAGDADESGAAVKEIIYSRVNKARKATKPPDDNTTRIKQQVTSQDLGLI